MAKTPTIKAVEVAANEKLGFNIDAEGVNTRCLDDSQISLLSILPEGEPFKETLEETAQPRSGRVPKTTVSASASFPIEYLEALLKIVKKSGSSHVRLFLGNDRPLIATWNFAAIGKEERERYFNAVFWLAPRVDTEGAGETLPPNCVKLGTVSEEPAPTEGGSVNPPCVCIGRGGNGGICEHREEENQAVEAEGV